MLGSASRAPSETRGGTRGRAAQAMEARHRLGDFISADDGNGGRSEHVGRGR